MLRFKLGDLALTINSTPAYNNCLCEIMEVQPMLEPNFILAYGCQPDYFIKVFGHPSSIIADNGWWLCKDSQLKPLPSLDEQEIQDEDVKLSVLLDNAVIRLATNIRR